MFQSQLQIPMPRAFALALVLVACGASTPEAAPPSSKSSLLGQAAPSFKRDALDGSKVDVGSANGKVTVVKFIAQYCGPCKKTLPAVEKLHEEHPEIAIVGVAEDEHESDARDLSASMHLTFPVVFDKEQVLAARWRVHDLPVTYVLDGKGNVAWVGGPEKSESDLVAAIRATKP